MTIRRMPTEKKMTTKHELMDWAGSSWAEQNSEGSPEEALLAGIINAMDTDCDKGFVLTDAEFCLLAYREFNNMGYKCK